MAEETTTTKEGVEIAATAVTGTDINTEVMNETERKLAVPKEIETGIRIAQDDELIS